MLKKLYYTQLFFYFNNALCAKKLIPILEQKGFRFVHLTHNFKEEKWLLVVQHQLDKIALKELVPLVSVYAELCDGRCDSFEVFN